jgi:hypothetical protein
MSAELEFLQGQTPGRKLPLTGGDLTLGRDQNANIQLSDHAISRVHAKLFFRDSIWYIADLDSANGTFVNGARITASPAQLRLGDVIQLGPVAIRFQDPVASAQPTQAWVAPQATPQPPATLGMTRPMQSVPMAPAFEVPAQVQQPYQHPMIQPGMQQQVVIVQGKQNLTWLWIFLCIVALGPCGLFCVGLLALAVLPFAMVIGGLIAGIIGTSMYQRFRGYPGWEGHATKGLVLMVAGFAAAAIGAIWIFVAWLSPGSRTWNQPTPSPSSNERPFDNSYGRDRL